MNKDLVYETEQTGDDLRLHIEGKLPDVVPVCFIYVDGDGHLNIDTAINKPWATEFAQELYQLAYKWLILKN